jgi:hypothetical protein
MLGFAPNRHNPGRQINSHNPGRRERGAEHPTSPTDKSSEPTKKSSISSRIVVATAQLRIRMPLHRNHTNLICVSGTLCPRTHRSGLDSIPKLNFRKTPTSTRSTFRRPPLVYSSSSSPSPQSIRTGTPCSFSRRCASVHSFKLCS